MLRLPSLGSPPLSLSLALGLTVCLLHVRRTARQLLALRSSLIQLCSSEWGSNEWTSHRLRLSSLLHQTNTYSTWSLALIHARRARLLYLPNDTSPSTPPSSLGVTSSSSPRFLKSLDLGGTDQRLVFDLLDRGETMKAQAVLLDNKRGEEGTSFILTGGPLESRLANARRLHATFPKMTFVAIHPEDEGRMTLRSSAAEIRSLLQASGGELSHGLLVAKGSTDLHLAWLDVRGGIACEAGQAASSVHRLYKSDPSQARELFLEFVGRRCNQPLMEACEQGSCAIIFAGTSVHALGGASVAAAGNYFRRITRADAEASDAAKAEFERFLILQWNVLRARNASRANRFFVGAIGPVKNVS